MDNRGVKRKWADESEDIPKTDYYCLVNSDGARPFDFKVLIPTLTNVDNKDYVIGIKRISFKAALVNTTVEPITITMKAKQPTVLSLQINNQAGLTFANKLLESSTVTGGIRETYWSIRNKSDKAIEITVPRGFLEKEHSTTVIPAGDTWLGDLNSGVSYPGTVQVKELYKEKITTVEEFKVTLRKQASAAHNIPNLVELKHDGGHFKSHYKAILRGTDVNWTVTNTTNKKFKFWFANETRLLINQVNEVCFDLEPAQSKTLMVMNKAARVMLPQDFIMKVQEVSALPPVKEQLQFKVGPRYFSSVDQLISAIQAKVNKVIGNDDTKGFTLKHETGITKLKLGSKVDSVNLGKGLQRVLGFLEDTYTEKAKSVLPTDLSNGVHQVELQCSLVKPIPTTQNRDAPILGLFSFSYKNFGKFISRTYESPMYRPLHFAGNEATFTIWNQGRMATFLTDVTEILLHIKPK